MIDETFPEDIHPDKINPECKLEILHKDAFTLKEIYEEMKNYKFSDKQKRWMTGVGFPLQSERRKGEGMRIEFFPNHCVRISETFNGKWAEVATYRGFNMWNEYCNPAGQDMTPGEIDDDRPSGSYLPRSYPDGSMYWADHNGGVYVCTEKAAANGFREMVDLARAAYERGVLPRDDQLVKECESLLFKRYPYGNLDGHWFAWYCDYDTFAFYHTCNTPKAGPPAWVKDGENDTCFSLGEIYVKISEQARDAIKQMAETREYFHFTHTRPGAKIKVGGSWKDPGYNEPLLEWEYIDENGKEYYSTKHSGTLKEYPYDMIRAEIEAEWKEEKPTLKREKEFAKKLEEYIQKNKPLVIKAIKSFNEMKTTTEISKKAKTPHHLTNTILRGLWKEGQVEWTKELRKEDRFKYKLE